MKYCCLDSWCLLYILKCCIMTPAQLSSLVSLHYHHHHHHHHHQNLWTLQCMDLVILWGCVHRLCKLWLICCKFPKFTKVLPCNNVFLAFLSAVWVSCCIIIIMPFNTSLINLPIVVVTVLIHLFLSCSVLLTNKWCCEIMWILWSAHHR